MISLIINLAFSLIVDTIILWLLYLAVMALQRANTAKPLTGIPRILAYTVLLAGWFWDFIYNITIGSIVLLDLPREFTLSQRLGRLARGPEGWRKRAAVWIATNLLNPFSNGGPHVEL